MELRVFFEEVGGDYEKVIGRMMSEDMIKRFLGKFLMDPSYPELKKAWEAQDIRAAFLAVHTLKGTALNLGLDRLAVVASTLTEQLRNATALPPDSFVEEVDTAYQLTIEKINQLEL